MKKKTQIYGGGGITGDIFKGVGKGIAGNTNLGMTAMNFLINNAVTDLQNLNAPSYSPYKTTRTSSPVMAGGGIAGDIPINIEGGEVVETPEGAVAKTQGKSHEQMSSLGPNAQVPAGTKIFSKRLGFYNDKGEFISHAKKKEHNTKKEEKLNRAQKKRGGDRLVKNALARTKMMNEKDDEIALQHQDDVKKSVNRLGDILALGSTVHGVYANGTGKDGVGEDILSLIEQIAKPEELDVLQENFAFPNANPQIPKDNTVSTLQTQIGAGGRPESSVGGLEPDMSHIEMHEPPMIDLGGQVRNDREPDSAPVTVKGDVQKPQINSIGARPIPNSLGSPEPLDTSSFQILPGEEALVNVGGVDTTTPTTDQTTTNADGTDNNKGVFSEGNSMGSLGSMFSNTGAIGQFFSQDKANPNFRSGFGNDGMRQREQALQLSRVQEANSLQDIDLARNTMARQVANNSRGAGTKIANLIGANLGLEKSKRGVRSTAANQMMQAKNNIARAEDAQDRFRISGMEKQELADRQDFEARRSGRINAVNKLGQNFQHQAKMMNQQEVNDLKMEALNNMGRYFKYENGKLVGRNGNALDTTTTQAVTKSQKVLSNPKATKEEQVKAISTIQNAMGDGGQTGPTMTQKQGLVDMTNVPDLTGMLDLISNLDI